MDIAAYIDQVRAKYASRQATEHSYRPALLSLFESIDPAMTVINEPKKSDAGMPDFLFQRGDEAPPQRASGPKRIGTIAEHLLVRVCWGRKEHFVI